MGIADVGKLSLAQYLAIRERWNESHGEKNVEPPSPEQFEQAMLNVRGVVH